MFDNQVDKCLSGELVGDTIAVAILSPGNYPFVGGELDWPNVIKGSTNQLLGVVLAQGFEDKPASCNKDRPTDSYFTNIPAVAPGGVKVTKSHKLQGGDDYVQSTVTLQNLFAAPIPGSPECVK